MRNVIYSILFLTICFLKSNIVESQTTQRYLSLGPLNLEGRSDYGQDLIEAAAKGGFNAFHVTIQWNQVYPTATSQPNWQLYDNQLATCQKLGMRVALRVFVCRNRDHIDGFWTTNETQRDQKGTLLTGLYINTIFSYAHQPSVDKAKAFVQEVHRRYENYLKQGVIIWTSVATTPTQEIGYHFDNYNADGSTYPAVYDYSEPMQVEFRRWLTRKYSKISRLNARWQTEYGSFDEITPPTSTEPYTVFFGEIGTDWYIFRHLMLRSFIEQTTDAIKKINPNYKVITDFGSVFDQLSGARGSYAFVDLNRSTDGVKINDGLDMEHHFSMDVIRNKAFAGRWVMNEVFVATSPIDTKEVARQIDENFANGAHWVNVVAVTLPQMNHVAAEIKTLSNKWLKSPYAEIKPQNSMKYELSRILAYNYFNSGIFSEWTNKAGPIGNRQPVDIMVVEDLLADSLQGSLNRSPIVKNAIPTKTIKVNTDFNYKLSSEVFKDIDGIIAKVEAQNLPNWLTFSNNTFTGRPTQQGSYSFTLRAYDDDGAWVETNFTIVVGNTEKINLKPIIKKKILDFVGLYKQPFSFVVLDSIFYDPDGFISKIEISGLPTWAKLKNGEIVGIGSVVGEYPISIKAYDDEDAVVQSDFKIKIVYPTITFNLIQAGPPIKRQLIQTLSNNDVLNGNTLPSSLNIYSDCNATFTAFELELSGPNHRTVRTLRSPFGLYESDSGFATIAGTYRLTGKAFFQKELISSSSIQFKIANIDPATGKPILLDDWAIYPNPFDQIVSVKLPANVSNKLRIELVNLNGQYINLPKNITTFDQSTSIDMGQVSLNSGVYFLKVLDENNVLKTLKIVKR